MAKCPKCGYKLKLTDIDQLCPKCHVNIRLYGFEETFYREAKTAELSQAGLSCFVRRLKCAFIGSKLTIARLCVMLLPAAALVIPGGNAAADFPFRDVSLPLGIIGLVNAFTGGDFQFLLSMAAGNAEAAVFSALRTVLFLLAADVLLAVLVFVTSVLGFLSLKNMQKISCVISALGVAVSAVAAVFTLMLVKQSASSVVLNVSFGGGMIIAVLMFAAAFTVSLLLVKKGIPVEYDEGLLERSEIWKQVKAGKVKIDDLPYPVVETEETRKTREEINAAKARFHSAEKEGEMTDDGEK